MWALKFIKTKITAANSFIVGFFALGREKETIF